MRAESGRERGAAEPERAQELDWWTRRLAGAPRLELPTDRPRTHAPSAPRAVEPLELPASLLEALAGVGRAAGVPFSTVLLAAFEVLLHRYTGEDELVVGVTVASRPGPADGVVGPPANTIPLRLQLQPDASFAAVLAAVRDAWAESRAHGDVPLERIAAALDPDRRGPAPLLPVLFDDQAAPPQPPDAAGHRLRPLATSGQDGAFELALRWTGGAASALGEVAYRADLFDAGTVRRLTGHLRSVLEAVAADPGAPISRLPLLRPEERDALLAQAAATCRGTPPEERVVARFEAQAARNPDAPAVIDALGAVSYAELDRWASAVAARLRAAGVGPGARVAVSMERSRAMVVALLGTLKARAAYVPLDPRYPADRVGYVLEDAAPAAILTEAAVRRRLPDAAGAAVIELDPASLPDGPGAPTPPEDAPRPDLAAYVIYTSGSTGRPKGVEVSDRNLSNFLTSMQHTPGLAAGERVLSVTTISFDIFGLEVWLPLVSGGAVELVPTDVAADGPRLRDRVERSRPALLQATPATWRLLIEAGWAGDPALRILVGGEALPRDLAGQLLARAGAVWNMYGPTETTIWSSLQRVAPGAGPVPIGLPVDHTRLYVLDRHGAPQPWGVRGEIFIGGAGVANGYFRRPELTAERFLPDPFAGPGARMYRTGDAGRLRPDGTLEYLGRLDHQLKIRGFRIEPGEIEAVLQDHPAVRKAVVVGHELRPGDLRLVAYAVAASAEALDARALRDHCRRRLPDHMVPAFVVQVPAFPLTPNGKLDRKALPAPTEADAPIAADGVPPRDALEAELARLWGEVLGVEIRSVRDGFFDLGGHSLLAARLFSRIEQRLGASLPLALLLEAPTIERLAAAIRDRRAPGRRQAPGFEHLLPLQTAGRRTPFFCVHGAGGHALNLQALARHLPDRPFYGLQARGVDGTSDPHETIEEMAAAYLAELRRVQPGGPYLLGGYCGGGLVAFEMAHRLRAAGEEVALLAVIDLYRPGVALAPSGPRHWAQILRDEPLLVISERALTKVRRDLRVLSRTVQLAYHRRRGRGMPHALRDEWLTRAFDRAEARYALRPFPAPLLVVGAREADYLHAGVGEDLGWAGYGARLQVRAVPGDHHTLMREPNVRVLAEALAEALDAAESGAGERGDPTAVAASA